MSYLGRYTLGQIVPLTIRSLNSSGVPTNPAAAPYARIYSGSGFVKAVRLPILDSADITGTFKANVVLNNAFSTGFYHVAIIFTVSGTVKVVHHNFEIVAGGSVDGSAIEIHYFRHPARNFLLAQTDTGRIKRLNNPRFSPR